MNEAARLMCDLALDPDLRTRLRIHPDEVLSRYTLSAVERSAIADGSGDAMLALLGHAIGGSTEGMQAMVAPSPVPRERETLRPEVTRGQPPERWSPPASCHSAAYRHR